MAVERAGDTEFGLDAHDSPLHIIELTGCQQRRASRAGACSAPYDLTMADQDGVTGQLRRADSPWRAVGLFLLLTGFLSGIFWVLINATQTSNPYYIWLLMWMPGISAPDVPDPAAATEQPGLTWNWRYVVIGYLIPIIYCLVASLGIWILGFGGFPNTDAVQQAEALGLAGAPTWIVIAMFVVVQGCRDGGGVGAAAKRRSAGAGSWCRNWPRCSRSRVWRCCRNDLGFLALSDHVWCGVPRCRLAGLVLAVVVHLLRWPSVSRWPGCG